MSSVVTLRKIPGHAQGLVVEDVDVHGDFWSQQILAGNAVVLAEDEPAEPRVVVASESGIHKVTQGIFIEEPDDLDTAPVIDDEVAVSFESDDELLDCFDSFDDDLDDPED